MLDAGGHVATWNVGAERIKGYRAQEIVGSHFSQFYREEEVRAGKPDRELATASATGRFEEEGWRVRKDGSLFWANVIITAVRDESGELVGFAKVTRDLTERRRAEEEHVRLAAEAAREAAAREQTETLRAYISTTIRSIGDAVMVTDAAGRITLMNTVSEALTGWSEDEARGRPLAETFHIVNEYTRARVQNPVEQVLEHGTVVGLANHTLLIARDGREIPIDDSGAPIRSQGGAIQGVVLVFRDITTSRREQSRRAFLASASLALAESLDYELTLRKVARLSVPVLADWCAVDVVAEGQPLPRRVAVAHLDPEKVRFAEELGARYPPDVESTRGVPNVIRTGRPELVPEITDEMLVSACADEEQLRLVRSLGLRSAMIVPLVARGRVLGAMTFGIAESARVYTGEDLAFAQDLGARCAIALENARLYASEQLARKSAEVANRAKDEFLAMVSHELRTPLNAISGWAKMLSTAALDETKRARALDTIHRNAGAMTQLIEDLLDVSRIISGRMRIELQPVDLASVIEAAVESIRPAALAKAVDVHVDVAPGAPSLAGDPVRLQQVVWNLLSNAVKFTQRGGSANVRLGASAAGVEISVSDTGRGIAPQFLPHVFDPFRQEDTGITRSRGGLGLGLAITHKLVDLHGGTVEARSEGEGRGATFIVRLPVARRPAAPEARTAPEAGAGQAPVARGNAPRAAVLAGTRILAVDDDEDARDLIKAVLEEYGCRVILASGVTEALEALERETPDVLISDIAMPDRDGYDLIRLVRALPPERGGEIPAAALTAYARPDDRSRLLQAGYSTHITKPVDPDELVAIAASLARPGKRASS